MKVKLIALMLVVSAAVSAGGYRHSFGVALGTMNGLSYKGYVSNNLHFVLQVDAYWQMGLTTNWAMWTSVTNGERTEYVEAMKLTTENGCDYQSVMVEPSFMYQGKIGRWEAGNMYWFAGAGVGLGGMWGGNFDEASLVCQPNESFRPWIKMSEHIIAGVEFSFNKAPLVLGIELKPGLAQGYITSGGNLYDDYKTLTSVMFDWGANFTLRYCFGDEKTKKTSTDDKK